MQNNSNESSVENKEMSSGLDSILENLGDSTGNNTDTGKKFDDAMKKLDALFEETEDDIAWLDNIMSEDVSGKKPEDSTESSDTQDEEDDGIVVDDIITAENQDAEAEEIMSSADTEDDSAADIPVDVPADDAVYTEDTDNDDDIKIFTPGSNANKPKTPPSEVDLEAFEGDGNPAGEYVHNVENAAQQQENSVNSSLGKLFGLDDGNDDEKGGKHSGKNSSHKKLAKELGAYEEINMADPDAVGEGQRKYYLKKCRSLISMCGAAVLLAISLYIELAAIAGFPLPSFMYSTSPTKIYALADLQIMCFSAIFVLDSLLGGFLAMLDKKFSPASCAFTVFSVCTVQAVASAIFGGNGIKINMFCCIGCLALFMLSLYDYLRASADDKAYRIAASTSNKFGAYELGVNSLECSPFASHINMEKAKVISVCKGSVYEGFVGRNEKNPEDEKNLGKMTAIISGIALLVGIFVAIFSGATASEKIYAGITGLTIVLASSIPVNIFIVSSLPKYLASRAGKAINAALVGQNASEEYKGLSVVAFDDTEVFLPKDVRISSIKTYGGMALDEAVVIMSKIYGKIGGPLSKIFAKMVDIKNLHSDVRLVKVYPDAIEVNVDGRDVCLATASYLGANGIRIMTDSIDASYEQSHGSILFMVCGGKILAKFYIKYSMNPVFEKTLGELHDANLCVGIKTLDPCITNDLVFSCLEKANYALSVIKGSSANDIPVVRNKVNSGVVALGSVHNFLEMLLICEKTGRTVKINNLIKLLSSALCIILSTAFVITHNGALNIAFSLIIQLFWLIPVTLASYFNK